MNVDAEPSQTAALQAQPDGDLHFVAKLLGDPVASHLAAPPCTRQPKAAKKRRRLNVIEQPEASPSDNGKALLARYKSPTSRNGSKQFFCEACSCSVPARDNDWQVHIMGIKHQRQLVSLLHTGQFGNSVVSLFEADPEINASSPDEAKESKPMYRQVDKARLQTAKTQVMKGLLNLGGHSVYTKRIAEHYNGVSFCRAWSSAALKLTEQAAHGDDYQLELRADELVCISQMLHHHGSTKSLTVTSLSSTGLAHPVSEDQTQAWKCMEDSIAISMLLTACQSLHSLDSLVIGFTHVGTSHQTVQDRAPRKDPFRDISRIYGPVWFDLESLLLSSLNLRSVSIALSCQYPWNVNMPMLKTAALQGHTDRGIAIRTALLMGIHARLGANGNLRHLPVSILRDIMTIALPQKPCKIFISTANDSWAEA